MEDLKIDQDIPFKIHVAIDFGTDGMGIAYAYDGTVNVHNKWNTTHYGITKKPKTTILLDEAGDTQKFGIDAKHFYMELNGAKRNDWMLFERFKMLLYGMIITYFANVHNYC